MLLALGATAIVVLALLSEVLAPRVHETLTRHLVRHRTPPVAGYDPGRERRAEARARMLLKSCVNDEEWAMYRDLGFIRVWGRQADRPGEHDAALGAPYAYLVYPHKPILAYLPQTGRLLNEYCSSSPTRRGRTARRACPTPTTYSRSGWR